MDKNRLIVILSAAIFSAMLSTYAHAADSTRVFSVKDFGATGDGKTLDTKAVQEALD